MSEITTPTAEEIIAMPDCSTWLRNSLITALNRDPIDAANDAEMLALVLAARAGAIMATDAARLGIRNTPQS